MREAGPFRSPARNQVTAPQQCGKHDNNLGMGIKRDSADAGANLSVGATGIDAGLS